MSLVNYFADVGKPGDELRKQLTLFFDTGVAFPVLMAINAFPLHESKEWNYIWPILSSVIADGAYQTVHTFVKVVQQRNAREVEALLKLTGFPDRHKYALMSAFAAAIFLEDDACVKAFCNTLKFSMPGIHAVLMAAVLVDREDYVRKVLDICVCEEDVNVVVNFESGGDYDYAVRQMLRNVAVDIPSMMCDSDFHGDGINKAIDLEAMGIIEYVCLQRNPNLAILKLLCEHGDGMLDSSLFSKMVPLTALCRNTYQAGAIEILLNRPSRRDEDGNLQFLCNANQVCDVRFLKDIGYHIREVVARDCTPLLVAWKFNNKPAQDLLLAHKGTDPNVFTSSQLVWKNSWHNSVSQYDQEWKMPLLVMALAARDDEMAKRLLRNARTVVNPPRPIGLYKRRDFTVSSLTALDVAQVTNNQKMFDMIVAATDKGSRSWRIRDIDRPDNPEMNKTGAMVTQYDSGTGTREYFFTLYTEQPDKTAWASSAVSMEYLTSLLRRGTVTMHTDARVDWTGFICDVLNGFERYDDAFSTLRIQKEKMFRALLCGWRPHIHHEYCTADLKDTVLTVLLVAERQKRTQAALTNGSSPILPPEMWHFILTLGS